MELTQEFIEANGLAQEQVEAITKHIDTEVVPTLKKDYDGLANKNAEAILDGAAKAAKAKFGVDLDREQGEKIADYFERISEAGLSSKTEALKIREAELEDKLKNFKGSDELKAKYEKQLADNDALLQKVAKLEPLEGLDVKLQEKDQELTGLKKEVAYGSVKPSFPDTVNKYEAEAKWQDLKRSIEDVNTIELIDGKPYAIDKENPHKKTLLSDLVNADENIKALLQGRQQKGVNGQPVDMTKVDGVPFSVPKDASNEEISSLVREHVTKELGSPVHKDFPKKFKELYTKILSAK